MYILILNIHEYKRLLFFFFFETITIYTFFPPKALNSNTSNVRRSDSKYFEQQNFKFK